MNRRLTTWLLVLLCTTVAFAQRPPRPQNPRPPRNGPPPGDSQPPSPPRPDDGTPSGGPPPPQQPPPDAPPQGFPPPASKWDRERDRYMDEASESDRQAFVKASPPEQKAIIDAWKEQRRRREEQAFVEALPQDLRAEIDAMRDPVARRARVVALRVDFAFDRAAEDAEKDGVATSSEIAALRNLPSRGKAEATLELQKKSLLQRLKPEVDRMPAAVRREVVSLPPKSFFEHPAIDDLRNFRFFTSLEREQIRQLVAGEREALAAAIEKGARDPIMGRVFLDERTRILLKLAERPRNRLAREIRDRMDRPSSRPSSRPEGFHLPPQLFDQLTPEERDVYRNLPDAARHDFAVRRFGRDALREARDAEGPDRPPRPPRPPR